MTSIKFHVRVCVHVCVCHIFTLIPFSHSFLKIFLSDLQSMFMAVKTCLQKICPHLKKTTWLLKLILQKSLICSKT